MAFLSLHFLQLKNHGLIVCIRQQTLIHYRRCHAVSTQCDSFFLECQRGACAHYDGWSGKQTAKKLAAKRLNLLQRHSALIKIAIIAISVRIRKKAQRGEKRTKRSPAATFRDCGIFKGKKISPSILSVPL